MAAAWVARAGEQNAWPAWVGATDPAGRVTSWTGLGPFLFSEPTEDGGAIAGFRPFYVRRTSPGGDLAEVDVLYPMFHYRTYGENYYWSVYNLINRFGRRDGGPVEPPPGGRAFDVWPFYFSRSTGDPATSYKAVLPIVGPIKNRLGYDRLDWFLFPLYVRTERRGAVSTDTPFPFVRTLSGAERGFALWPLFGWRERPGVERRTFGLWPLLWNNTLQPPPDAAAGTPPTRQVGVLPFYSSETGPGLKSETYLWPFFGYTDRTIPDAYHETRYFWPFLVQGRGENAWVNRWGPFYTHSKVDGIDKTWILWPLWEHTDWHEDGRDQSKDRMAFFVYSSLTQRNPGRPGSDPARKVQLWPIFTAWDNGGGHRQWEVLSPFEPLFADNDQMRQSWTPLVSLFRLDERPSGEERGSLLWNAVSWDRRPAQGVSEFHLGPLWSSKSGPSGSRIAVGGGLFGFERAPGAGGWRPFLMEFSGKPPSVSTSSR
jgi:hypothetical protein